MVGLHYLKHVYEQTDESMVERFVENPYWQYFCGFEFFQHSFRCDPTSLVRIHHSVHSHPNDRFSS